MQQVLLLLQRLTGWRRIGFAFVAGSLMALAFAPYHIVPILGVSIPLLIILLDQIAQEKNRYSKTFLVSLSFAWGYLFSGLYWMSLSFLHFAQGPFHFAGLMGMGIIGVFLLAGFIACFYGGALMLFTRLWTPGWPRLLVFAIAWTLADYARGHLFSGLPWNLPAQASAAFPILAQPLALLGPYGYGFIWVIVASTPVLFLNRNKNTPPLPRRRADHIFGALIGLVVIGLLGFSVSRLLHHPVTYNQSIALRIVQPNIPQRDKIDPEKFAANFMTAYRLSQNGVFTDLPEGGVGYVIWPENAAYNYFQDYFKNEYGALELLQDNWPARSWLLTGAIRIDQDSQGQTQYYNSLQAIPAISRGDDSPMVGPSLSPSQKRAILYSYDKHHLAPFGEYVPLGKLWRQIGLDKILPINDAFARGKGPQTLALGHTKVAIVICFEAIFPGETYPKGERPDWLLTITNDAWFGDSVGPRQHLDQARMRAVETGLPMIRAANTGISAVIDPVGRLLEYRPLQTQAVIETPLPNAIPITLYARFGDKIFFLILLASAAILTWERHTNKLQ